MHSIVLVVCCYTCSVALQSGGENLFSMQVGMNKSCRIVGFFLRPSFTHAAQPISMASMMPKVPREVKRVRKILHGYWDPKYSTYMPVVAALIS